MNHSRPRYLRVAAFIAFLMAALATAVPFVLPEAPLRNAVLEQIESLTGRKPQILGQVRFALLPMPRVVAEKIVIPGQASQKPLIEVGSMKGDVRLLPLLAGRLEIVDWALDRAFIALAIDKEGRRSWAFERGLLAESATANRSSAWPMRSVRLVESQIVYSDARTGASGSVGLDNVSLSWLGPDKELAAEGVLDWRGQKLDTSLYLAHPAGLIAGQDTNGWIKATGQRIRIKLMGKVANDGQFNGSVDAQTSSLRELFKDLGMKVGDPGMLRLPDVFRLRAPNATIAGSLTMPSTQLTFDNNTAAGVLTLTADGPRLKITGTLASEILDLSAYALASPARDRSGRESDSFAESDLFSSLDWDMRLSASQAILGRVKLNRVAASIVAQDGHLDFSLGDATAYGGSLSGRLSFATMNRIQQLGARLSFKDVDMNPALTDAFGFWRLSGLGSGAIDVAMSGRSMDEAIRSTKGAATLRLSKGAWVGLDLVDMMRRIEKRPLSAKFGMESGRTAFEDMDIAVVIRDGIAQTTTANLAGRAFLAGFNGRADLGTRKLDLAGRAVLSGNPGTFALPFRIRGPWDRPSVDPDADSLIRQSGAAQPLLKRGQAEDPINILPAKPVQGDAMSADTMSSGAAPATAPLPAAPPQ